MVIDSRNRNNTLGAPSRRKTLRQRLVNIY